MLCIGRWLKKKRERMPRILLVDDDESFRPMLHETLERFGYEVVVAVNGLEALDRYRERPADLVLTDVIMPDKEGLETIRDIRREWPDAKIIAMSGGGRTTPENYLKMAQNLGAGEVLTKPFSNRDLLEAIQRVLGRHDVSVPQT
jgi:CheY-like chemotaxis protein